MALNRKAWSVRQVQRIAPDKGPKDCAALCAARYLIPLQVNSGVSQQPQCRATLRKRIRRMPTALVSRR
jgi:hypothetical protein